jgi:rhodanese-related sulfurtransferase
VLAAVFAVVACGPEMAPGAYTVDADEAVAMIEGGERTIIDVRTPAEFAESHVAGALNIDVLADDFDERIAALDPERPYLVYCRAGNRSAAAAERMEVAGIRDIADAGGLTELARAGAPLG